MSNKKKKGEREKKNNEKGQRQTGIQGERQRYLQRKRERDWKWKTDRKKRTKGIEDMRKEMSIKCLFCKEKIWERLIENV